MQVSQEELKKFMELYKAEMGVEISEMDAKIVADQLTILLEILIQPLPLPVPQDHQED